MKNMTLELEAELKAFTQTMKSIWIESEDLYKLYWSGGPSSEISGLGNDDPVTVGSKLSKAELVAGLTVAEQLKNFFGNASVSQSDYWANLENILHGNSSAVAPISAAVESMGSRLLNLSGTLLTSFNKAKALLDIYNDSQISLAVGAISDSTIVFGANSTKALFVSGITLVEQFKKMINNEAVATADYASTLAKWEQIS